MRSDLYPIGRRQLPDSELPVSLTRRDLLCPEREGEVVGLERALYKGEGEVATFP